MKADNLLLTIAVIAVIISVLGAGITYSYLSSFKSKWLTGSAVTGLVNLTVESSVAINFTTATINWGSGIVTAGLPNATLNTAINGAGNVTDGNWTGNTAGLVIENIGNKNVTINLSAGKDAAGLLGGTNPYYQYNVSNVESNSCLNASGGTDELSLGIFKIANTTTQNLCKIFRYVDTNDTIRIDIRLVVPSDSKTGELADTLTAAIAQA